MPKLRIILGGGRTYWRITKSVGTYLQTERRMDITVYMDVAGAEVEASDSGLGGRRGQKQKVCFLVKRAILLSD